MLHIRTLGGVAMWLGGASHSAGNTAEDESAGQPIKFETRTVEALLIYLACQRRPVARDALAELMWPERTQKQARANLSVAIHRLRQQLDPYLLITRQSIGVNAGVAMWLDVAEFEAALATGKMAEATALYGGDFLDGFYRDGSPDFEQWALLERERLRILAIEAFRQLIGQEEASGDPSAAIANAHRLLQIDPLHEATQRQLMHLLAQMDQRSAALEQYERFRDLLALELGVEPNETTSALYEQIRSGEMSGLAPSAQLPRDSAPLIGRQREWQQLAVAWQRARQGRTQVAVITGEVGIGKTRLAESFAGWIGRQAARVAYTRAYAEEGSLAFSMLIDLLRTETLARGLANLSEVWLVQVARLLPELLEKHPKLARPDMHGDPSERQHFFEALARALLADGRPLLVILDDLQWCDHETLEWLRFLLRFAPKARLLVIVTVRSGEVASDHPVHLFLLALRRDDDLLEVALERLSAADTGALATQVAGRELAAEQAGAIYEQTEGNPLFIVEIVRAAMADWAAGRDRLPHTSALADRMLPERVQAVIELRLAKVSAAALELLQVASVLRRSFTLALLGVACRAAEADLAAGFDELWQRRLLRAVGENHYDFSHQKIAEVVYSQIPPLRLRLLHRQLAGALKELYVGSVGGHSIQIAGHYAAAGEDEDAIRHYQDAAHFAMQAYAYQEGVEYLRQALVLTPSLTSPDTRRRYELQLQVDLGFALMMLKGFADPTSQQAYQRALALSQFGGVDGSQFEALWGLHEVYLYQGNYEKARQACEECEQLAARICDPQLLLEAHHAYWGLHFYFYREGEGLQAVVEHARKGISLYRAEWRQGHLLRYAGHDPAICAANMMASSLWLLGYPEQALDAVRQSVASASALGHVRSLSQALKHGAKVAFYRREPYLVLDYVRQMASLVGEGRMQVADPQEAILRGWALGQLDPSEEALALVRQGVTRWQETGTVTEMPSFLALLAETYAQLGQIEAARQSIEEALVIAETSGEDYYRAELYRLQGALLLEGGVNVDAAESDFIKARTLAEQQGVKSLELRAAISLGQLWAKQGKVAQAYALLAGVFGWFSEGFDSVDLREAKGMLLAWEQDVGAGQRSA